ncbi:MAG: CRISPR-associated endonuclease Cas2 [Armatimonadetes bacterium]|nr:CRISPR-associated endonuclease Cas2 [Armatimonadota bacterium]MDW8121934.1 CRISPR-associated endonuclease Cas2 [Armatimonadota bacterium]
MYVIIVYDVDQSRVTKVCQFLRRFLQWVQNSAFEGDLTESQIERIRIGLSQIIDADYDSVYIYQARDKKYIKREVLGQTKALGGPLIE